MNEFFRKFATTIARATGSMWAFILAITLILVWLATGPIFNFSTNWQLFINSFTTIVTFLMVFLIQNTQNRDSKAIHLKLDELVRVLKGTRLQLLDSEDLSDEEINLLLDEFKNLRKYNQRHTKSDK